MSLESHLEKLKLKHQELDARIEAAQRRPSADDLELKAMKRAKLRLKEQIERSRRTAA